jgi:integrase
MAKIQKRKRNSEIRYRVQVRIKGHPPQTATFPKKSDAKRWGQQTEGAIREGRYFRSVESKKHTLGEMIDRYVETVLPRKGSQRNNQRSQLSWWKDQIGDYLLSDITPALISKCRDKLASEATHQSEKRSPATVNRYLVALSHVYTIAVNEWGWLDDSPIQKVRHLKEPRGRVRFLNDEERERLLAECKRSRSPYLHLIVLTALSTGMRQGEILNLKGEDVDLQLGRIIIQHTKNGERRTVPLTGLALDVMREHGKNRHTDLIFPGADPLKPMDIRAAWEHAVQRADIQDFHFHDLRHTAASYLVMDGATLVELAEILGHKTMQMVKRYAHLSESHIAGGVSSMTSHVFGGE